MRKKMLSCLFLICLVPILAGRLYAQSPSLPAGDSPVNPAPIGVTLADIISCGSGYDSHQTYDVKITVLETARGEGALKRIKSVPPARETPEVGFEYVLARLRLEFYARTKPGDCVYELSEEDFTAISSDGKEYNAPSAAPPDPTFFGKKISSGESAEGWAVFLVGKDDRQPLLTFRSTLWFRL
ncbi:MAG TPA: hypothetical protein VMT62_10235 [Syntrophorhabdaceae bacterium]|nr:hypothetical protein [Syntrophorhabdaceae bacterium]